MRDSPKLERCSLHGFCNIRDQGFSRDTHTPCSLFETPTPIEHGIVAGRLRVCENSVTGTITR